MRLLYTKAQDAALQSNNYRLWLLTYLTEPTAQFTLKYLPQALLLHWRTNYHFVPSRKETSINTTWKENSQIKLLQTVCFSLSLKAWVVDSSKSRFKTLEATEESLKGNQHSFGMRQLQVPFVFPGLHFSRPSYDCPWNIYISKLNRRLLDQKMLLSLGFTSALLLQQFPPFLLNKRQNISIKFLKPLMENTCNTTKKLLVAALCQKKGCEQHMSSVWNTPKNSREHPKNTCETYFLIIHLQRQRACLTHEKKKGQRLRGNTDFCFFIANTPVS